MESKLRWEVTRCKYVLRAECRVMTAGGDWKGGQDGDLRPSFPGQWAENEQRRDSSQCKVQRGDYSVFHGCLLV